MSGYNIGATRVDTATVGVRPARSMFRIKLLTGGFIV